MKIVVLLVMGSWLALGGNLRQESEMSDPAITAPETFLEKNKAITL